MHRKVLYPVLALTVGALVALLIAINKPKVEQAAYEPTMPPVRVTTARATTEYLSVTSQGTVQPRMQTELIPEVSGRVIWISPSLVNGGAFREDDTLLRIDDADYSTQLERSESGVVTSG